MTLFYLNCLFKDPIFKYIYVLRFWGVRTSTYEFAGEGGQNSAHIRDGVRGILWRGGAAHGWPCRRIHWSTLEIIICDNGFIPNNGAFLSRIPV